MGDSDRNVYGRLSKRWLLAPGYPGRAHRAPHPPPLPLLRTPYSAKMAHAGASGHGLPSLDDVLTQITTNAQHLASYLKTFAPRDVRETILASTLGSGQDPLTVLDPQTNTLGFLYILYVPPRQTSVRLAPNANVPAAAPHDCTLPALRAKRRMLPCQTRSRRSPASLILHKLDWPRIEVRLSTNRLCPRWR